MPNTLTHFTRRRSWSRCHPLSPDMFVLFFRRRDWYWVFTKQRARTMSCSPLRRPSTTSWLTASCWRTLCCKSLNATLFIHHRCKKISFVHPRDFIETAFHTSQRASVLVSLLLFFKSNKAVPLVRHCCRIYIYIYLPDYSCLGYLDTYVDSTHVGVSFFFLHIGTRSSLDEVDLCSLMCTHVLLAHTLFNKSEV